ncbi:alpha/beta hydrolase family protein [Calditrichota bacterium]
MKFIQKKIRSFFPQISIVFCALLVMLFFNQCTEFQTEPQPISKEIKTSQLSKLTENGLVYDDPYYYSLLPGRDLIIYAHGYYSPEEEDWQPEDDKIGETYLWQIANQLGFSYATIRFTSAGLNAPEAVTDLINLVNHLYGLGLPGYEPEHIYLIGASNGALITTLAVEQHPDIFSGGLATCGPVGNFRKQINYLGDFHIVFNYFFPRVIPGDPAGIPGNVIDGWDDIYKPAAIAAINANPGATRQLLNVTRAAIDPADPTTVEKTITDLLWYNVFATNDAINKLDGKPFDNKWKWYWGSDNDWRLNRKIKRYRADGAALNNINQVFQTSGDLAVPLVMLHTTSDPIVPYWHEPLYRLKVFANGSGLKHTNIPVFRYGHCEFEMQDILVGIVVLVFKVALQDLFVPESLLPAADSQTEFLQTARKYGTNPKMKIESKPIKQQ